LVSCGVDLPFAEWAAEVENESDNPIDKLGFIELKYLQLK